MTVTIELLVDDIQKAIRRVSKNNNLIIINNEDKVLSILEQLRDSCGKDDFYIKLEPKFGSDCFHEKDGSKYVIAHLSSRAHPKDNPTLFYESVNKFVAFIKT